MNIYLIIGIYYVLSRLFLYWYMIEIELTSPFEDEMWLVSLLPLIGEIAIVIIIIDQISLILYKLTKSLRNKINQRIEYKRNKNAPLR